MIAIAKQDPDHGINTPEFEDLLPAIRQYAFMAFRSHPREERDELTAEVVAGAFCAFHRLVQRGKTELAYATPLARYAIRQVRSGRHVGGTLNIHDVSSQYCQQAKDIQCERLEQYDEQQDAWQEVLVEDRQATPADIAATRIDFSTWLRGLSKRSRRIAKILARGETTQAVAKRFGLTAGRISQLRRELQESWQTFQGEAVNISVSV
jgi:RNA polymerase sigma factor (sigma-70 family)